LNRRAFLKSLVTAAATVAVNIDNVDEVVERLLQETARLHDVEFVAYIQVTMQMWVSNPAHCAVITNISE
jgi:hypothetical protein